MQKEKKEEEEERKKTKKENELIFIDVTYLITVFLFDKPVYV